MQEIRVARKMRVCGVVNGHVGWLAAWPWRVRLKPGEARQERERECEEGCTSQEWHEDVRPPGDASIKHGYSSPTNPCLTAKQS
ncbi:unnamed protein product [Heligmosomoides polygyrus]|uniref:Uncharacterized protein n=1 Tax=Heligmosomoides polygyrus TaxID=6339 RepID=A0A183FDU3_HELPZ|nr:unnamed protein product [Heligmosomoides polygyrus]